MDTLAQLWWTCCCCCVRVGGDGAVKRKRKSLADKHSPACLEMINAGPDAYERRRSSNDLLILEDIPLDTPTMVMCDDDDDRERPFNTSVVADISGSDNDGGEGEDSINGGWCLLEYWLSQQVHAAHLAH
jgi:hypothetical protein